MKKISTIALYGFLALMLAFGLVAMPARAADHLDGPMAKHDGRLDITDVYAFQSPAILPGRNFAGLEPDPPVAHPQGYLSRGILQGQRGIFTAGMASDIGQSLLSHAK